MDEQAEGPFAEPCFFDLISHTNLYEAKTTSCAEGSIILNESPRRFASNKGGEAMSIELSEIKSNNEFLYQAVRANVREGTLTIANVITHCKKRAIPKENIIEAFRKELLSRESESEAQSDLTTVKQALEKSA